MDGFGLASSFPSSRASTLIFDLCATGFSVDEIDLKIEAVEASGGRKPAARRGPAATRPGDVWTLGSSRLACGDDVNDEGLLALDGAIRRWEATSGDKREAWLERRDVRFCWARQTETPLRPGEGQG